MNWKHIGKDPITGCKVYAAGALKVLLADTETEEYRLTHLYHLSISHPMRYPKWDEIKDARYTLIPDKVMMAMYLPPRGEYVNIHNNCFHLYESKENPGGI